MARNRNHKKCTSLSSRAKFYKSLRGYIITLLVLLMAGIVIDNGFFEIFRLVAFWWGIGLSIHFVKFRGLPGTNGWLSDDWFDWIQARYPKTETAQPSAPHNDLDGEDYDPLWKDKDLV